MSTKIINITPNNKYSIAATDEPEIFRITYHTPGNFETYFLEIEDFDPRQDQIYLPKDAKRQDLEVWLKDVHPYAYEMSPFIGEYKKITRAIISISSKMHIKNKKHPELGEVYQWSLENYPGLTNPYYNEEYINGIFVDYWQPGLHPSSSQMERSYYLSEYAELREQFGERTDFEIYLHDDLLNEEFQVIQRHPSAMKWEKYKINNPDQHEEYLTELRDLFGTPYFAGVYAEQIEAESNLVSIRAKDATTEELVKSIYYHDGSPAWKTKENAEAKARASIKRPDKFNKKLTDKITNFNPSTDTLEIGTDSFGLDSSATFASGKNKKVVKKRLANLDIDFLYDEKKGGLYFNENGSAIGFGDGGIIAILKGAPDLSSGNLEFF